MRTLLQRFPILIAFVFAVVFATAGQAGGSRWTRNTQR